MSIESASKVILLLRGRNVKSILESVHEIVLHRLQLLLNLNLLSIMHLLRFNVS